MGKKTAFLSALSFYLLFSNPLSGQIFPIRGNLVLTPPYSPYISDYVGLQGGNLRLFMLAEDANIVNYRIRFKMTIEGLTSGVKVKTSESFLPAPVYITGGVPLDLDGLDLSGYFLPANLDFASGDASLFNRTAQLPEGYYRICFQAFDYTRNIPVSNEACFSAWMMLNQAPLLNFPSQGSRINYLNPQNLLFQWTGMHLASPNAAGLNVEYVFSLVEVNPPGRNINDAIVNTRPLLETRTDQPFLLYDIGMPVLQAGKLYAWRVRAVDLSGRDLFVNNGYSETWSFIYGESCNLPTRIASEVLGESSARINYNADPYGEGYSLQYRVKGTQNDWSAKANGGAENKFLLEGLEADTEYEYRLRTDCKGLSGAWTNPYTFKTAAKGNENFVCGVVTPPKPDLSNRVLISELKAGDTILAADQRYILTEVAKNGDNTFTGMANARFPMFGGMVFGHSFDKIEINTDKRMIGGVIIMESAGVEVFDPAMLKDILDLLGPDVVKMLQNLEGSLEKLKEYSKKIDDWVAAYDGEDKAALKSEYAQARLEMEEGRRELEAAKASGNKEAKKAAKEKIKDAFKKYISVIRKMVTGTISKLFKDLKDVVNEVIDALRGDGKKAVDSLGNTIPAKYLEYQSLRPKVVEQHNDQFEKSNGLPNDIVVISQEATEEPPIFKKKIKMYELVNTEEAKKFDNAIEALDKVFSQIKLENIKVEYLISLTEPGKFESLVSSIQKKAETFFQQDIEKLLSNVMEKGLKNFVKDSIQEIIGEELEKIYGTEDD